LRVFIVRNAAMQAINASNAPTVYSGTTKGGGFGVVVGKGVAAGVKVDVGEGEAEGVGEDDAEGVEEGDGEDVGVGDIEGVWEGDALGPRSPMPNGVPVRAMAGKVPIILCCS
jgi:hypothetical protein